MVVASLLITACYPADPPPLTAPAVSMSTTLAAFRGDGYQHGPVGSATRDVVRDNALPVSLPDGYTMQVYSDTTSMPGASAFYFQTNSASLSPPGDPSATLEAAPEGHPVALLPWNADELAVAESGAGYVGVWPTGGAWIPPSVAGGNRVLLTYQRVRVNPWVTPATFSVIGQGVAEYAYPGAAAAIANGIGATRLADDLFPNDNALVMGSPVFHKGWVYLYGCTLGTTCYGARAIPTNVTSAATWQWFDGTNYAGTKAQRRPLAGVGEFSPPNVVWVPALNAYAMTSSRLDNKLAIRWATSAVGPWTAAQVVTIPGCTVTSAGGGCFGGVVRPESAANSLVLSYASYGTFRTRLATLGVSATPR